MRTTSLLIALAAATSSMAFAAPPADVLIPGEKLHTESITSTADGTLIIGARGARKGAGAIFRAGPGATVADIWIAPGTAGISNILGVYADDKSHTLWACSFTAEAPPDSSPPRSALYAFDLATGAPKGTWPLPNAGAKCNDIAVGADGTAYVTDTGNMQIVSLAPGGKSLSVWAGDGAFGPMGGILDGIAVLQGSVIVNTLRTGKLYSVPIAADGKAGAVTEVKLDRSLKYPDGQRSYGEDGILLVDGDEGGRLMHITLSGEKLNTGKVATLKAGYSGGPTGVTVVGNTAYVVEAQFEAMNNPDVPLKPFKASAVALRGAAAAPVQRADAIFVNANVYTPDGWRSALAVKGGKFIALGSDAEMRRLASKSTRVTDLAGSTVLPGLFDMHVHPMSGGNGKEGACKIAQGVDATKLLQVVAACTRAATPGQWVTGGQWQAASMGATPITAATLDTVSPKNPVLLFDISGHSIWVNSKALTIAGIGRDTPNPEGGIIERDASGAATGILRETARQLMMVHLPPPTATENLMALRNGLKLMLSYGITALTDAMVLRGGVVAYDALADSGELKQTVQACIAYSIVGKTVPDFDALIRERSRFSRPKFRPDCVKVFADGVPTESHTAAMLEPYADSQPNAPARGLLLFDPAVVNPLVAQWDRMGLTVLFHAAGDASVRASIDAIEFARAKNGMRGPRHQVGHSTFVSRADLLRFRPLNIAIEYSPYLWAPSPINDDIIKAIGPERIERVWPIKEGFDAGALVVAGSDWAVVPAPDPWYAMETAITRRAPGGSGTAFGPQEAISLQQALDMFTINAAKRMGMDGRLGSLEMGKNADFIVLDRNPFRIPVTDIHKVKVRATYIDGAAVYERVNESH